MLHEEVALYTKLTGEDGWHVPIIKVGAYLDGYEKGLSVLEDIKAEIIHSIAKQYSEHNEVVPVWLSIGDISRKEQTGERNEDNISSHAGTDKGKGQEAEKWEKWTKK